jgi:hypothetical protein
VYWLRSIIKSKQFVFFTGPNKEEFSVHQAPIEKLLKPLKDLITGSMAEACDGQATLSDADPDTFVRFRQFAYTGRYEEPVPVGVPITEIIECEQSSVTITT